MSFQIQEKTMKTGKKLLSAALMLGLMLILMVGWTVSAYAEGVNTNVNRFNVVLVVDKSGSLLDHYGGGTDPHGLRFDALRLFLGLLTEDGNNVGAVVFDEQIRYDSGMMPIDSMEDKMALVEKLEEFFPSYDTDLGGAVLRATELLEGMEEENGLPCMILLFSDGHTDFSEGNRWAQIRRSWDKAQQALDIAREQGIQINGILLNVDGTARNGETEFRLYTEGTNGTFQEISSPDSLAATFRHIYTIINNTEYTGAERVAFSEQGEAKTSFLVPNFGVEEVNVIVEHEEYDPEKEPDKAMEIRISDPDGNAFDISGHEMLSSRYALVKIPHPAMGVWNVSLKGNAADTVDITMVYNASMSVALTSDENPEDFKAHKQYRFRARVTDTAAPVLTPENLGMLQAVLEVLDRSDGSVKKYPMEIEDGVYCCDVPFSRGGSYSVSAMVGAGGFEVRSNSIEATVNVRPLMATVSGVADMLSVGWFHDDCWEVELYELFGIGEDSGVRYTLSDDYDGELTIEGGVLQARFKGEDEASFIVRAEDDTEQSAEIPFSFPIPAVSSGSRSVYDMLRFGSFTDDHWEIDLGPLFADPKGCDLRYTLSDDHDGAVTVEGDILRLRPHDAEPVSFTLTAEDIFEHSAELPFELPVPTVTAKTNVVKDMLRYGKFQGFDWECDLNALFDDPKGGKLSYALSDDLDGALRLEDNVLHMDLEKLKKADFSITARDLFGLETELPFSVSIPAPNLVVNGISETVKTGLFQEKTWERRLDTMFRDPKGSPLTYELSDDFGGAVKLEDNKVQAVCKGLKKAAFNVKATDQYGVSAEFPITLTERNMTLVYALWTLAGLALIGLLLWLFFFLRNRYW